MVLVAGQTEVSPPEAKPGYCVDQGGPWDVIIEPRRSFEPKKIRGALVALKKSHRHTELAARKKIQGRGIWITTRSHRPTTPLS